MRFTLEDGPRYSEYLDGHLPGAAFVDLEHDLAGNRTPGLGHYPVPSPEAFAESSRRWGLTTTSDVVVYSGYTGISAGRLAWLLQWYGHDKVRILDGGLLGWTREGLPLETSEVPSSAFGGFAPRAQSHLAASTSDAMELGRRGQLVDVRARSQFALKTPDQRRSTRRPGRIPGAINIPATSLHRRNGLLRSSAEMKAALEQHGIDYTQPVGAYCGGGVASAWATFVLRAAGVDARLFTASWSEYAADPRLPVEIEP